MAQLTVKIDGDEQLMRALGGDMKKAIRTGSHFIALEVKREVAEYPLSSEANIPRGFVSKGNNRWYERGYGPRWARKDGSIGGRKTSEMLNRSWRMRKAFAGSTGTLLGSKASYSPVVHHHAEQAAIHKRRGWKTDKAAVEKVRSSGKMDRIMQMVIKHLLKG